jgi:TP901 family phage tail tape measure protein
MSNRTIEAILRVSAKLGNMAAFNTLGGKLAQVDRQAKLFNRTQTAMAAGGRELNAMMLRFAAPAAIGYGLTRSVKEFASYERMMTRTGMKLDASRQQMRGMGDDVAQIADRYALARGEVTELLDAYAETGATLADVNANLPSLAKVQQGLGASGSDVAATWDAAAKSFGLATNNIEKFFDVVAAGGAIGKFEGSDLARYLPSLMPVAATQGFTGMEGTERLVGLLETMRDYVGTSQEAATATADFLEKISSPDVEKRFGEAGINLRKELGKAKENGEDILLVMSHIINKATRGDASRLSELFGERDSRRVARLLMTQFDALEGKIATIRERSKGMISSNVNQVLEDAQAKIDRLGNSWDKLLMSVGSGFVDLGGADALSAVARNIDYATAVNSGLEKTGAASGFWDRTWWGITHDQADKDHAARFGGYRAPAERALLDTLAPQVGEYAAGIASSRAVTPRLPKDATGLPLRGPILTGRSGTRDQVLRDDLSLEEQYSAYGRAADMHRRGTAFGVLNRPTDDLSLPAGQSAVGDAERRLEEALSRGGADAADKLEAAGSKFMTDAERAGAAFGRAAGAELNRTARVPRAAPAVSGNLGWQTEP